MYIDLKLHAICKLENVYDCIHSFSLDVKYFYLVVVIT